MKKIYAFLAACMLFVSIQAADYSYLVFTNTSGVNTIVSLSDITFSLTDTGLQVTNESGTVSFTLTDLSSMQFSVDGTVASGIDNVIKADAPVDVYLVDGLRIGSFDSLIDAVSALDEGVYVVSDGTNSQKIIVK